MRMIILYILLNLIYQQLTPVAYASSSIENECKENSVRLQDEGSAYRNVNLCLGNSLCQRILKKDIENAMKNMYAEKNKSEVGTDELYQALSKKVETLERNMDDILDRLASLKVLSIGNASCPKGYTYYKQDKFCFKFYTECKSWLEARRACKNDGGDLISLKESNFDIFKQFAQLQEGMCAEPHVWVGTTDMFSEEGEWYWLNGETVISTFWFSGQPSNGNEHCGILRSEFQYNLKDRNCAYKNNFLCQIVHET